MRIKIFIANKIHDVKGGWGPALSVIMMLIINDVNFPRIVPLHTSSLKWVDVINFKAK